MKITRISVGYPAGEVLEENPTKVVLIEAALEGGEALEEGDVVRLIDLLTDAAGGAPAGDAPGAAEVPTSSRRRATGATAPATSPATADASANAAPASTEGRRRRTATEATEAAANPPAETGRRRRAGAGASADAAPSGTATASGATTAEPTRRRRAGAAAAPAQITDADVSRACSEVGREFGPALVMEILRDEFGVTMANEVPQDQRQRLLDELAAEVKAQREAA
jgi:hypothetical protein